MDSTDMQELLARAADGDRDAQAAVLEKYWPLIRHAVRARKLRMGRQLDAREATADLEQAAAMRILLELPKQSWQGGAQFAAWVKKLASLEVVDSVRHHRAQKRDTGKETSLSKAEDQAAPRSLESQLDDRRQFDALLARVSTLKADQAAALLMHHMGFTHEEIGDALDCSAEAARKLVTRAHKKLLEG